MDPITLLTTCAFAAVFLFALGLDLGFRIGRDSRVRPDLRLTVEK